MGVKGSKESWRVMHGADAGSDSAFGSGMWYTSAPPSSNKRISDPDGNSESSGDVGGVRRGGAGDPFRMVSILCGRREEDWLGELGEFDISESALVGLRPVTRRMVLQMSGI